MISRGLIASLVLRRRMYNSGGRGVRILAFDLSEL